MHQSPITDWIAFDGQASSIQPCAIFGFVANTSQLNYTDVIQVGCDQVCGNSSWLFDYLNPANLVTCGLWSSLTPGYLARFPILLQQFESVGLNQSNEILVSTSRALISSCFSAMDASIGSGTGAQCAPYKLFPTSGVDTNRAPYKLFPTSGVDTNLTSPVKDCTEAICNPRRLSPDVAGIGVRYARCYNLWLKLT